jgi:DNA-binding SARP family transcriptional activator/tetratricopeptide (TPR) repeat protein
MVPDVSSRSGGSAPPRLFLLGRVRLESSGRPVRLTELESGLLSLAALRERVGVDSLGEWLWAGDPPPSARNRVQSLVSGIRRKAHHGDPVIVTDGRDYRLGGTVVVDVHEWDAEVGLARAARATDPALALGHYDRALALFPDEPLQGAPDTAAVDVERSRLGQARLSVVEERHDAALRSGRTEGLVAELDALTAQHPFHEGFVAQLMLALAAAGQQSRALEVYRATHERLDDELGVQPSEPLRRAQQLVLAGTELTHPADEEPVPPAEASGARGGPTAAGVPPASGLPVPRTLPRRPSALVGRSAELAAVEAAAAESGDRAVVVAVTGLAGVGKSALALEAGHALRARFPDGALYHDAANDPRNAGVATALAAFLRILGVHPESVPAQREARVGLFRSLLDGRRVLVVVDNLATDGDETEDVVDLLPVTAGSMAVTTSRSSLPGLGATHPVPLRSLALDDTMALLTRIVGAERVAAEPEGAREVARLAAGMPLAVRIVGGRAVQRPDLSLDELADRLEGLGFAGDVPDDLGVLRAGIDRVLDGLPAPARQVVEAVAHLPVDTFSGWVAGAVLADRRAGDAALDVLLEASLVDPVLREDHEAQYRLHDLVRAFVRVRVGRSTDPTGPGGARAVDELVAVATWGLARDGSALTDLPNRFIPAPPRPVGVGTGPDAGRPRRGARGARVLRTDTQLLLACASRLRTVRPDLAWRLVADCALGHDARSDLELWLRAEQVVTAAVTGADDDSRLGAAYLMLCRAWLLQDQRSASRVARDLADQARRHLVLLGEHRAAAAAALVVAQTSTALGLRAEAEAAVATAEESLAHVSDVVLAAWAAIARGTLHNDYDELPDAAREFTRARGLLADEPVTVANALATLELSRAMRRQDELGPASLLIDEALRLFGQIGDVHLYSYALDARAEVSLASGRADEALDEATTAHERALASRDAFLTARARRTRSRALLALGRLEEAEREVRIGIEELTAIDRPLSVAFSYQVLAAVLDAKGENAAASEALRLESAALRRAQATAPDAGQRTTGPA